MQIKCEWCGGFMDDSQQTCPNCGGVNNNVRRVVNGTPKTIEELQEWYRQRGLPPYEVTRFFIGQNVHERRAFGIYKEGGQFIVYKNKNDGQRAVRYKGTDEAYAVNEIYLKLKSEILNQKTMNSGNGYGAGNGMRSSAGAGITDRFSGCLGRMGVYTLVFMASLMFSVVGPVGIVAVGFIAVGLAIFLAKAKISSKAKKTIAVSTVVVVVLGGLLIAFFQNKNNGYYKYNGTTYYNKGGDWYYYDSFLDDWYDASAYSGITDSISSNYGSYLDSYDYSYGSDYSNFENSDIYEDNYSSDSWSSSSDSSWDSGYDWDSGSSWDSGGSDWDSDWIRE